MSNIRDHEFYIKHCIELGNQQMEKGNVPFATILLLDGEIVAEGYSTVGSDNYILGHSEFNLVNKAVSMLDAEQLSRAILYSNAEPCAMCTGAIFNSGIRHVVYGLSTEALLRYFPDGLATPCREIFDKAGEKTEVAGPMLEEPVLAQFRDYWGY